MERDPLAWILAYAPVLLLVLVRVASIIFLMPVFGGKTIPLHVKAGLCLAIAIAMTPFVPVDKDTFPEDAAGFFFLVLAEFLVGLTLSLMLRMILAGLQTAAHIAGFQMGFSVASAIDPLSGAQSLVVTEFVYFAAIVLFLASNGHHALLRVVHESFAALPVGGAGLSGPVATLIMDMAGEMFVLSIKLMAPVIAILLFVQVALGILARTVPQINILMMSFNITIAVGLVFFGLTLRFFWPVLGRFLDRAVRLMPTAVGQLAGS